MIDRRLLRIINSGRCFVLVGSGPSCEVGYRSWHELAGDTYARLLQKGCIKDKDSYDSYLSQKKYPELFRQAEVDLGDRHRLIDLLKSLLTPAKKESGFIYDTLSKWPFACYLTTNFDDELVSRLRQTGEYFVVLQNQRSDFSAIRDGSTHLVQKLHSDLDHPDEAVVTSADYRKYYVGDEGQYFRDKLRQIFEMFDILIIGHSLSDPDIDYVLQLARKTASELHPIYMIASNYTQADEREYEEKYNIVLLRYLDTDGKHAQLRRLLSVVDKFIVRRGGLRAGSVPQPRPPEEVKAASSLFLYRRLQHARPLVDVTPLVLAALSTVLEPGVGIDELLHLDPLSMVSTTGSELREAVGENVIRLVQDGLIASTLESFWITESGLDRVQEIQAIRDSEREQAYGQFAIDLRRTLDGLTAEQEAECVSAAETVIVDTFANRGLTIANRIFAGQSAGAEELSDIFGYISGVAAGLGDTGLRVAFLDAMYQFIVSPSTTQKRYLASISQGYFLYHLLGLDPNCHKVRKEAFEKTLWFFDSSVFLSLAAIGCHNHEYASEFFAALSRAHAAVYTTSNLAQEAWEHFDWAINFVRMHGVDSAEFLRAALVKGSYKQNLFLDGYIRLSAEGRIGNFGDYLESVSPEGLDRKSFGHSLGQHSIRVIEPSDLNGFVQDDWGNIEDTKARIKEGRQLRGTYRSDLQIDAEAEIWILVKHLRSGKYTLPGFTAALERCYFVSQSRVLDSVFQSETVTTWTPEAVYRYLSSLPENHLDPELLQQCMLHEYFYAGVSFIDKERYLRFFGPSVDAAKAAYREEKEKYLAETEHIHVKELDDAFERTPDLEKPFFVAQMGWRLAGVSLEKKEDAQRRAIEAEAKVRKLEAEKGRAWRDRQKAIETQEAARLKNLQDPRHLRKRMKQAKKRRKKK